MMENIFVQTLELNKTYRINVSITKTEIYQKSNRICYNNCRSMFDCNHDRDHLLFASSKK